MKVSLYCKSVIDFHAKLGAYCAIFINEYGSKVERKRFNKQVITPTHADCAAYAAAIHIMGTYELADHVTELDIVTDSGKVKDMIEIHKADKHCEPAMMFWRDEARKLFPKLETVTVTKYDRLKEQVTLNLCLANAKAELHKIQQLIK